MQIENYKLLSEYDCGNMIFDSNESADKHYDERAIGLTSICERKRDEIISDYIGELEKEGKDNNFAPMVKSGAKGTPINIPHILGLIGAQSVDGKRLEKTYNDRTFPHYPKGSESLISRGFITKSYSEGIDRIDTFCLAAGSRVGLIDTSLKTAVVGYISKKLNATTNGSMVAYDGTVRIYNEQLISYKFGTTGFEVVHLMENKIDLLSKTFEDIVRDYA